MDCSKNWKYDKNMLDNLITELDDDWQIFFKRDDIYQKLSDLFKILGDDYDKFNEHLSIYPSPGLLFTAFKDLNPKEIKVVILGQDPYHQPGQAMGLSFSVPDDIKVPPSLVNIYKELLSDIEGFNIPYSGDLTAWKNENILLLNSSLTVLESKPMRHMKYWKPITDLLIEYISDIKKVKIFMLWGNSSKSKKEFIKNNNFNYILDSNHPSPLSANRGGWFGCKHFSKCNIILQKNNISPINWCLS